LIVQNLYSLSFLLDDEFEETDSSGESEASMESKLAGATCLDLGGGIHLSQEEEEDVFYLDIPALSVSDQPRASVSSGSVSTEMNAVDGAPGLLGTGGVYEDPVDTHRLLRTGGADGAIGTGLLGTGGVEEYPVDARKLLGTCCADGADGEEGANDVDGKDGVDGATGKDGANGVDCVDGAHGRLRADFDSVLEPIFSTKEKRVQVNISVSRQLQEAKEEQEELQKRFNSLHKNLPIQRAAERFQSLTDTDSKFYFYIGLTRDQFEVLFRFLGDDVYNLHRWRNKSYSSVHDPKFQLCLTLMRLRRGYNLTDLSYQFRMGRDTIGNIFITWIQLLYKKFGMIRDKMFVPKSYHAPLPAPFKNSLLRDVRIVIDCTEFQTESSGDFKQQGNLYSNYKSHTTAKVLTGVAPSGALMFVSDAYEGSISDREIVIQSGFLDYIQCKDIVLADRGFKIHDLLAPKKAKLVIPPFLEGRKEFSTEEIVRTKIIATARIHVERYNERIKNFELLSKEIPLSLVPLLSQIVFVVCCLVNFQEPLV
jgi:hypothetical protein